MKKLFLTSAGLPIEISEEFLKLLNKDIKETKLCFITTASIPEKDKWYVEKDRKRLLELGFKVQEMDLRKENEMSLNNKLKNFDVVYVEGGNTFYLLKYVWESGFDKAIKPFLTTGVYVGVSAGSIIAGLNIETANWKHADRNIANLKDLTGLKLVDFVIAPHIDGTNIEETRECANRVSYPVVALSDKQAILIDGKTKKIIGVGDKLIFNTADKF